MSFDKISRQYKEKSLVQQKAALKLLDLLQIKENDNVLDCWMWTRTYYK